MPSNNDSSSTNNSVTTVSNEHATAERSSEQQRAAVSTAVIQAADGLSQRPDILDEFVRDIRASGLVGEERNAKLLYLASLVGEERNAKLLYLASLTRHFDEPVSVVITGNSSGGKSYLLKRVLAFVPSDGYHCLTAMSERALVRWDADMRHRILVLYEMSGMPRQGMAMVRTLLTEGEIRYIVNVPTSEGGWEPHEFTREGPTSLLMTTTQTSLYIEDDTRFLSLTVSDSQEQLDTVARAIITGETRETRERPDLSRWHELDHLLSATTPRFVVPFAETLAEMIRARSPRFRRDLQRFMSLMYVHAWLHHRNRQIDADGCIVVSLEDYEAVHGLMADIIDDITESVVSPETRETVEAVEELGLLPDGLNRRQVRASEVADRLGLSRPAATRRIQKALDRGYLVNRQAGEGNDRRTLNLDIGDPLPSDQVVLPTPADLTTRLATMAVLA